jgi:type IX secretion system PorP/SprF family membrane protein
MLQTFSFHTHLGENGRNGVGGIIFNDRNGYHSQKGLQIAYAHHINFGNGGQVNKLSFGLAGSFVQNQLDETSFDPARVDPIIAGVVQNAIYYNLDFGFSYHLSGFFFNATLKNALFSTRDLYTNFEQVNLRNYVGSIGYFLKSGGSMHVEPSFMIQYKEYSGQMITDMNLKFYFELAETGNMFYLGTSYRKDWDDLVFNESYHNITPIIGVKINKLTFAYTYTYDLGKTPLSNSGFHQITLGYNFNCRRQIARMSCPEID